MAIKITGTTVINDSREIENINNINRFIQQPEITSPTDGNTGVILGAEIQGTPYSPLYAVDVRDYREFQIDLQSGDFSSPERSNQVNADSWTIDPILDINELYKVRIRDVSVNGTVSEWSDEVAFQSLNITVNEPTLTVLGTSVGVPETPELTTNAFSTQPPDEDTHLSTDWQILDDQNNVVYQSLADTNNKTSIVVPAGFLAVNTTYTFRARHVGALYGNSEYNTVVATTAESFTGTKEPTILSPASSSQLNETAEITASQYANLKLLDNHAATKIEAYQNQNLVWSKEIQVEFDPSEFSASDQSEIATSGSTNIESSADNSLSIVVISVQSSGTPLDVTVGDDYVINGKTVRVFQLSGDFGFVAGLLDVTSVPVSTETFEDDSGITQTIIDVSSVIRKEAYRVFDKDNNTSWGFSGSEGDITYTYDNLSIRPYLKSYVIRSTIATRAPQDWIVEGSFDGGITFTQLDSRTGITWTDNESKTFTLPVVSGTGYDKYRVTISSNNGGEVTEISRIIFDTHTESSYLNELYAFLSDSMSNDLAVDTFYEMRVGYKSVTESNYAFGPLKLLQTPSEFALSGEATFTTPGTYSWTAPTGIPKVSVVCVGAGGTGGGRGPGGGGGALGWKNEISVVGGQSYTIEVGETDPDGEITPNSAYKQRNFRGTDSVAFGVTAQGAKEITSKPGQAAPAYVYGEDGGGNGGRAGRCLTDDVTETSGAGGAGGYQGSGGEGERSDGAVGPTNGSGGAGAGSGENTGFGGGGVGLFGIGLDGIAPAGGGSGGDDGSSSNTTATQTGGNYGGGGNGNGNSTEGLIGADGAVRIIWGAAANGLFKSFPNDAQ